MAKQPCRVCRQVLPATAFKEKHNGTRTLACRACLAKHRSYHHAYQQKYRHAHYEHLAERKRQYRAQHKDENAAYQRHYYLTNKARLAVQKHEYHQKNRAKELARRRRYYDANRAKKLAQWRRYYWENREKVLARMRRYYYEQKARKRGANAVASPGKDGSSKRKKADAAHQHGLVFARFTT